MTGDLEYTRRLVSRQGALWKRWLGAQAPYRWNLLRLRPGLTLEIGCGIGRNLAHLGPAGVGIERNAHSVAVARARGLRAYLPEEFKASAHNRPGQFDSLLAAHLFEHMTPPEAVALLREHAAYLKPDGRVISMTPQELGFRSDPTHVTFMDFDAVREVYLAAGFTPEREYSFPFPRVAGRFFRFNEFVAVGSRTRAP
jgi:SAM-dependent methyltransferase